MYKRLEEISWKVDEPTYRADAALSYSTLATYNREGFNKLEHLFDKKESPSLTFGSAVDALITGGETEFNNNFIVADFPALADAELKVVKPLFERFEEEFTDINLIPDNFIIALTEEMAYHLNWKPETRARLIKERCREYYRFMQEAQGKTILNRDTYNLVRKTTDALYNSDATRFYFAGNNPTDDSFVREYQLKFKATLDSIPYRCMADLLITDNVNKVVYPIDLKTSSHTEWDFYYSFIQWSYSIQARLYWLIIRDNMDRDEHFKDYRLANYKFIVVNKNTLTPLVWEYRDTQKRGTLYYGFTNQIECKDPLAIGKELSYYLGTKANIPMGVNTEGTNDIIEWLNKIR